MKCATAKEAVQRLEALHPGCADLVQCNSELDHVKYVIDNLIINEY